MGRNSFVDLYDAMEVDKKLTEDMPPEQLADLAADRLSRAQTPESILRPVSPGGAPSSSSPVRKQDHVASGSSDDAAATSTAIMLVHPSSAYPLGYNPYLNSSLSAGSRLPTLLEVDSPTGTGPSAPPSTKKASQKPGAVPSSHLLDDLVEDVAARPGEEFPSSARWSRFPPKSAFSVKLDDYPNFTPEQGKIVRAPFDKTLEYRERHIERFLDKYRDDLENFQQNLARKVSFVKNISPAIDGPRPLNSGWIPLLSGSNLTDVHHHVWADCQK